MKKILTLGILCSFMLMCGSVVNAKAAKKYFCEFSDGHTYYSLFYTPGNDDALMEECNNSFFYKDQEDKDRCINKQKLMIENYKNRKCAKLVEKKMTIDGSNCLLTFAGKKLYTYSCSGGSSSTAMEKIRKKYKK